MRTNIFLIASFIFFLSGCQKADIATYGTDNYIQFVYPVEDSTTFPFLSHPGQEEFFFPIAVELVGNTLPEDRKYKLTVDKKNTTAIEGTHFQLPEKAIFHAEKYQDTCLIKFIRSSDLKTKEVRLVLHLKENNDFKVGQQEYSVMIIRINDQFSKPAWWDERVTSYYLGEYSDLKYELFIRETGSASFSSESELRAYTLKFKYYLQKEKQAGRMVKEKEGSEMKVTVLG